MGIPQGLAPITYGQFTQSTQLEAAMSLEERIRHAEGLLFDRYNLTNGTFRDVIVVSNTAPQTRRRRRR